MTNSRVAVIVPCHNYGRYLDDALMSLVAQTQPPDEVVVVDDGSTDDTPDVVDRWLARSELRVISLHHDSPRGVAAAMNAGIAASSAEFVAIVDADDTCEPGYVLALASALLAAPDAGFAYPRMRLYGDEQGVYLTHPYDLPRLIFEGNYIPMPVMMRRTAFLTTKGFRQLPTHVDWDLWLSLAEQGWPGVLVDEILYNWRRHGRTMTHRPQRERLRARLDVLAKRRLVWRHLPAAAPWTWRALQRRLPGAAAGSGRARLSASGWVEDVDVVLSERSGR